jgi:hypothetical protein
MEVEAGTFFFFFFLKINKSGCMYMQPLIRKDLTFGLTPTRART